MHKCVQNTRGSKVRVLCNYLILLDAFETKISSLPRLILEGYGHFLWSDNLCCSQLPLHLLTITLRE